VLEEFARNNPAVMILLVGLFVSISTSLIWRMLNRMEKKIDEFSNNCTHFRNRVIKKEDFEKYWKPGREEIWKRVNHHRHDNCGNVVIPLKGDK
jgi:hypothetical protein